MTLGHKSMNRARTNIGKNANIFFIIYLAYTIHIYMYRRSRCGSVAGLVGWVALPADRFEVVVVHCNARGWWTLDLKLKIL